METLLVIAILALTSYADDPAQGKGLLGVAYREVDGRVEVTVVGEGSPAEKAGFKAGDRLLEVDDQEVSSGEAFVKSIAANPPGTLIRVRIERDGKELVLRPILAPRRASAMLAQRDPPRARGGTVTSGGALFMGNMEGGGNLVLTESTTKVSGNVKFGWSHVLDVRVDDSESYARLDVKGTVRLDGLLYLDARKLEPRAGDRFEVISANGGLKGRFSETWLPELPPTLEWDVLYDTPTRDYDGDGVLDVTLEIRSP